jgi:lipoprotein NlpI
LIIPISTISRFEIASANYVRKGEKDSIQEIKSANLVTNRTLERVMVKAIDLGDLSEAKFFAEKLETFDPGRSTIYYTKSIYYDSISNLNESRIEMLHALELNPLNCYFLLGSSVIDTKIGNFDLAQSSINKVFQLCPQMPGLPNTQKYLDDTKS